MAGDVSRKQRLIPFSGGVLSDEAATELQAYDMENLLPPAGNAKRLRPRDGVEYLLTLETAETDGYVIHEVKLDDSARTHLVVVSSAETGRVELISEHTDMEGYQSVAPKGGGELPGPPPPPIPDIHPVFAAIGLAGETVRAEALFYNTATDTTAGPVILNYGGYLTQYAYLFRTENYIVGIDRRNSAVEMTLMAWRISDCVDAPPEGPAPAVNMVVYTDTAEVTPFKPVWAYAGDVVFIADDLGADAHSGTGPGAPGHDYRLFKVDLQTGTSSSVEITGLPSSTIGFVNREYDCDSVDTDGYLWTAVYGLSDRRFVKIDPATGAVVADGAVAMYDTNYGLVALPDGEMLYQIDDDTLMVCSADLQTHTALPNTEGLYLYAANNTLRNAAKGTKMLAWHPTPISIRLCDIVAGTVTGPELSVADHFAELPGSFLPDGASVGFIRSESSSKDSWGYKVVDADTGAILRTLTFGYDADWASTVTAFADAFAYGVKHVQGDRL